MAAIRPSFQSGSTTQRAAFLAAGLFLRLNGRRLVAEQADAARAVLAVAAGERDIDIVAEWIRARSVAG
jgi:death-on-curing protein